MRCLDLVRSCLCLTASSDIREEYRGILMQTIKKYVWGRTGR